MRRLATALQNYLFTHSAEYLTAVLTHLQISALAVLIAILIAVPLGIAGSHSKQVQWFLTEFFSLLRIIPSLAILFVCIPLLGTGVLPATVALTILAIPPILINTVLSLQNIPDAVLETATGMGMGRWGRFFEVELPLALPLILTGIRTATIEVIASATLAAYIGGGGLGEIIFTGLGLYRMDLLIIGGASVAVLSLSADLLFFLVQQWITRYQRV
ncbi:MAG TPA: glycine/betaine ABC transporter [Firmicutes bacterium]|nr:glycine/betaine ABC transporter [Bacillota bacterium]